MQKGDLVKVKGKGLKGKILQIGTYGLILLEVYDQVFHRAIYDPNELEVIN